MRKCSNIILNSFRKKSSVSKKGEKEHVRMIAKWWNEDGIIYEYHNVLFIIELSLNFLLNIRSV